MGVGHYENFPVASILLPRALRGAVAAIYRFARTADDIADEGNADAATRLAQLGALEQVLDAIDTGSRGSAGDHAWTDLAAVVHDHHLPTHWLRALLSAFRQDVTVARYATRADVLDYCRRSANPIGRMLLHLYGHHDEADGERSDAICSALQLINFLQDVAIDWRKGRVYLPLDALAQSGTSEDDIAAGNADPRWSALMRSEARFARTLMLRGAPLARQLGGRIGFELRLVVQGGLRILERIDAVDGDVFRHRPQLGAYDWSLMLLRALRSPPASTPRHDAPRLAR